MVRVEQRCVLGLNLENTQRDLERAIILDTSGRQLDVNIRLDTFPGR